MLDFVGYMKERHAATQRRIKGEPQPWSKDETIATKKLCSVFRDDDRTSLEGRRIIENYDGDKEALALVFRWCNKPSTLATLAQAGLDKKWTVEMIESVLMAIDKPFLTSAYKINPPGGLWNVHGIALRMAQSLRVPTKYKSARAQTKALVEATNAPFVSYQVMQDLRWVRERYDDEQEWALFGPGAARGLLRLKGEYTPFLTTRERQHDTKMRIKPEKDLGIPPEQRQVLLELIEDAHMFLQEPRMNMFEIEHNLCEWDKYTRMASGESKGVDFKPRPNYPIAPKKRKAKA